MTFSESQQAFHGLQELVKSATPFTILCDVNLPMINGIELKKMIDNDPILRRKSIPFIFLSTAGPGIFVEKAYQCCTVQGFFTKSSRFAELIKHLKLIFDYWTVAKTPSN